MVSPVIKKTHSLLIAAILLTVRQMHGQASHLDVNVATPEVALTYTWLHSNAPPGACGCFSLNGGAASFALPLRRGRVALAGEVADGYTADVVDTGKSINLSTYSAGLRFSPRSGRTGLSPFAQVLGGLAHLTGPLVGGSSSATKNAGAAFAATFGGGLDYHLNRHFALRLVQAEYLFTTFDNATNNRQNIMKLDAGAVIHFNRK